MELDRDGAEGTTEHVEFALLLGRKEWEKCEGCVRVMGWDIQ